MPDRKPTDISVVTVPVYDTGLGREAGYASDKELIDACNAERAAMDPWMRGLLDGISRDTSARVLGR